MIYNIIFGYVVIFGIIIGGILLLCRKIRRDIYGK